MAAALNGGNLWVVAALNGRRLLGGVKGDDDEKLCQGKPKKATVGGCGAQRRKSVDGCGAQQRKVVKRGGCVRETEGNSNL